jgi:2-polyprenyl-6-methoxyphenol hydroxylase-like FAD-dependent oxidoreductase
MPTVLHTSIDRPRPRGTVTVVGAGPVGLLVALCAVERGWTPRVLEREGAPRIGSPALEIQPQALELLGRLGLADRFLARGLVVERRRVVGARGPLGAAAFARYRGVLSIEQERAEELLRGALAARGVEVEHAEVVGLRGDGSTLVLADGRRIDSDHVVACDGRHSVVRGALGIGVQGNDHEGAYAVGEFADTTPYRADAAVFLTPRGLVESLPLPGGLRRWTVRRDADAGEVTADELVETIRERTGVACGAPLSFSGFHAGRRLADAFALGPVALAGDAAHAVRPGPSLGWLGAADLAASLDGGEAGLAANARRRRRHALAAIRRAELNLWLTRPTREPRAARVFRPGEGSGRPVRAVG